MLASPLSSHSEWTALAGILIRGCAEFNRNLTAIERAMMRHLPLQHPTLGAPDFCGTEHLGTYDAHRPARLARGWVEARNLKRRGED
jgi:hypothetical protein